MRIFCCCCCFKKKKVSIEPNEIEPLPLPLPEEYIPMKINPIYHDTSDDNNLFNKPAERIILNRKTKAELCEEYYKKSQEALSELDNFLHII